MTKNKQKANFSETFRENYRALITLVKMQLKEKMDFSYLKSKRKFLFKILWLIIEFAAITTAISVVFNYVKLLGLFSSVNDIPVSVISIVFAVMLLFSIVTDTIGLMKSLYFSKDNTVLLTFPATPSLIFFSKLTTYYIYELRKSFMYIVPMFIAYGMVKNYVFIYYPWLILMFVLISIVPVLISALLSIPAMFAQILFNRVKILQYILFTIIGAGAVVLVFYLISLIPENINFLEDYPIIRRDIVDPTLKAYQKNFAAIYLFTELIVGKRVGLSNVVFHAGTLPTFFVLLGVAVVLLILCFVCSKPLFCRMASTPFEFKKNNAIKEKKNIKLSPFASALRKELTIGLRSNSFIKLGGVLVILMPMAIFLLNKIYSVMDTRMLGNQLSVSFNVIIILLIMTMTNIDMASIYSRDGSSSYLNKVQPTSYTTLLFSKLFFPMIIALSGTCFTVSVFAVEAELTAINAVMIGLTVYSIYVAHLFSCAESDIMNPQYEQYATFNDQANNPNESMAGITAIIYSAVVFVIALFLLTRGDTTAWLKIGPISLAYAAFRIYTYVSSIKAFYKEKQ